MSTTTATADVYTTPSRVFVISDNGHIVLSQVDAEGRLHELRVPHLEVNHLARRMGDAIGEECVYLLNARIVAHHAASNPSHN